jgi:hypothetical protein
MNVLRSAGFYLTACLNVLLIFLSIFSEKIRLPDWLMPAGRFHPLILHFPLALLLVTIAIYVCRIPLRIQGQEIFRALFSISALTAVLTAIFGLFLSREGGYDEETLFRHQWMGVGISVLAFLVALQFRQGSSGLWLYLTMIATIPVLIIGSHFGGVLTHGEDFLNVQDSTTAIPGVVVTDSSAIYAALVEPVLAAKCYSCHNENKAKGDLVMTSVEALLKGGKNGPLWVPGDPLNSHIVDRMNLPLEDKKHMPPRGKAQLTDKEIALIETWIAQGADMQKRFIDYPPTDSFRIMFASFIPKQGTGKSYGFEAASASLLKEINTPYCYVTPIAVNSPALSVRFLVRSGFNASMLKDLLRVSRQVIDINLSNMTVKDEDLKLLKDFSNLEVLNLNSTDIKGPGLKSLASIPTLTTLSISGTAVDRASLEWLAKGIPSLRNIFCWNTTMDSALLKTVAPRNPDLRWHLGFIPSRTELLQLTPPQLRGDQKFIVSAKDTVTLKHPMPGVVIKYTLDGTRPDSATSATYTKPLAISKTCKLKAIAVRGGWLTSDTLEQTFFQRSAKPSKVYLLTPPDSNYTAKRELSLFDDVKGDMTQFKEHWLGVIKNDLVFSVWFSQPSKFNEVIISALKKPLPYIMPPARIELWAGIDSASAKMISSINPQQPDQYDAEKIQPHLLRLDGGSYRYFRIRVSNVKRLPPWHEGKGKPGWAFVDEVFFN